MIDDSESSNNIKKFVESTKLIKDLGKIPSLYY